MNRHDRRRFAATNKSDEMHPAEQFAVLLSLGRILVEMGAMPDLTCEQYDEAAAEFMNPELIRNRLRKEARK